MESGKSEKREEDGRDDKNVAQESQTLQQQPVDNMAGQDNQKPQEQQQADSTVEQEDSQSSQPQQLSDNVAEPTDKSKNGIKAFFKKNKKTLIVAMAIFAVVVFAGAIVIATEPVNNEFIPEFFTIYNLRSESKPESETGQDNSNTGAKKECIVKTYGVDIKKDDLSNISIEGNGLNDFDLTFLKLENDNCKNIVYSPLSIKYALAMLKDGANGETEDQITKVLGSYQPKKYQNSDNLSIVNAFFVNNAKKDQMLGSYQESLKKYNAEVIYDDFSTPDNMNKWIGDNTFGLINNLIDTINSEDDDFVLANTLAIDMEWKNHIKPTQEDVLNNQTKYVQYSNGAMDIAYDVDFAHEKVYPATVDIYQEGEPYLNYASVANKYDIIGDLGEENIRNTVQEAYDKWAQESSPQCTEEQIASQSPDLDEYIQTLSKHYGHVSSSTDFYFYDDDTISAFAKDLKTYNDTSLQYVAIFPKDNENIAEYIKTLAADDLRNVINNIQDVEDWNSYADGYVTLVEGGFTTYNFDYQLDLEDNLKNIGITNIFAESAKLEKIGTQKPLFIKKMLHKTNIAFSNDGIRAVAATVAGGGRGSSFTCKFDYSFDVPTKKIDIGNFSQTKYLFFIIDKNSKEVWFTGVVNE